MYRYMYRYMYIYIYIYIYMCVYKSWHSYVPCWCRFAGSIPWWGPRSTHRPLVPRRLGRFRLHIYIHIYVCMYIYVYLYICICIYTSIHICIHIPGHLSVYDPYVYLVGVRVPNADYEQMNTATIPLSPVPWSRFSGTFHASPIDGLLVY